MEIWIDVREACKAQKTGKGQWLAHVLPALARRTPLTALTGTDPLPENLRAANLHERSYPGGWRWHASVSIDLLRNQPDVFIAPTSFIVPFLVGSRVRVIPVVHDLIAFQADPHDRKATTIERFALPRTLRRAAHICTISNATLQDLLARFQDLDPKSITTIYAGPTLNNVTADPSVERTSIVCPATLCPRKNQLRLIQAYSGLPKDIKGKHPLVLLGGRGWDDAAIVDAASRTPGVRWMGFVDDAAYNQILSSALILAYPSLYEGFGLPVLDAFAAGIPVLTSNRGSLREVAAGCALVVDPESVESIRFGLHRLVTDAALRRELTENGNVRSKQYSWDATARHLLAAIDAAINNTNAK